MTSTTETEVKNETSSSAGSGVGPTRGTLMRAVAQDKYGSPDTLELREVEVPSVGDDEVLVGVAAAAANPADRHLMRGEPYLVRLMYGVTKPRNPVRGMDVAGHVLEVGGDVTRFTPGDEVYGEAGGSFAEYAVGKEDKLAIKPPSLTWEEAAAVPLAGVTALQGLRDHAELQPGQSVLINGASGGVGTYAVQIAKAYGAEITGVCSTRNQELVRDLGADHVLDYTQEDFTRGSEKYDAVFDLVGNHSVPELVGVLEHDGKLVSCTAAGGRWLGPMRSITKAVLTSPFRSQQVKSFFSSVNTGDLEILSELIESGEIKSVIDRTYGLEETPDAIRYLEEGHTQGKVVITI